MEQEIIELKEVIETLKGENDDLKDKVADMKYDMEQIYNISNKY